MLMYTVLIHHSLSVMGWRISDVNTCEGCTNTYRFLSSSHWAWTFLQWNGLMRRIC